MKSKNVKRLLTLVLSMVMLLGSLTGCGKSENQNASTLETENEKESETKPEGKEPVTLEWYYRGCGPQADTEDVEARVNELLKEYPGLEHVTVNLNCFPPSDYATQVTLAQTSGAQIDILNSVSLDYAKKVGEGSWMPLNDLISDELKAELPDWLWEFGSVDGNIYLVPNYQNAFNAGYMVFPKEYIDKYGNYNKMYATLSNTDLSISERCKCLEDYVMAVREVEGSTTKYATRSDLNEKGQLGYYFITPYDYLSDYFIVKNDGQHKVEYLFTTDEMKELYSVYADWFTKGIYAQDGIETDFGEYRNYNMLNDVASVYSPIGAVGSAEYVAAQYSRMWGFDVVAIPLQEYDYIPNSWGAGGNGVSSTCENPEEAIKFIEALTTGTELGKKIYNTMVFGIEGKHYTVDASDSNRITTLEYDGSQGTEDTSYAGLKWILGNSFYAYKNQAVADGQYENIKKYNESPETHASDHNGFIVSNDKISVQIDQVNAIKEEYVDTLLTGVSEADWEKTYDEFVKKLETAGIQDIIDEYQAQLDEWLHANGK